MADTIADSVTKASAATNVAETVPATTETLPPIAKEPAGTADASMVPSVAVESKDAGASAAPSSDTPAPEPAKNISETDDPALEPEKPVDPTPTPVGESLTAETAATDAPADSNGTTAERPKPVSVEEIGDEALPEAKPSEPEKTLEVASTADDSKPSESEKPVEVVPKADDSTTAEAAPATDSATAKNGEAVAGEKRTAEAVEEVTKDESPPEKKRKTNGTGTNGTGRKPGRPKKENKKTPAPVGKTLRKTRSQGAADL